MKTTIAAIVLAFSMFTLLAFPQNAQQNASPPAQINGGMMRGGMMGQGQVAGGQGQTMMGQYMNQMLARHQQMSELMDRLTESMAAMQTEKNPAALATKMAEHRALIEQMQKLMNTQGGMMSQFTQGCPVVSGTSGAK
jgi:hypothetical protein